MPRPLTTTDRTLAGRLDRYLGREAGVRRSAADIVRELPMQDQRTPKTGELVATMMAAWVARGVAVEVPGPRGGKGWALTAAGAALIARTMAWKSPAILRAEKSAAEREVRKVDYHALIARPEGRETVKVRALTMEEAARLARQHLRWTGERVLAIWEAGVGEFSPTSDRADGPAGCHEETSLRSG